MKTNSTEKIQEIDTYNFKKSSIDSTKLYKVYVNFETENVIGFMYDYGFRQQLLDTTECVELLENVIQHNRPMKRDITPILNKIKTEMSI